MEIIPSKSFGPFILGQPISECLSWLQQKNKFISHVELKYYDQEPLKMDLILDLQDGVLLRFEPHTQQLKSVEIYDVPKVKLSYSGALFSAPPNKPPTLVTIYERFGPTHPGEYDASNQLYYLHYPGLSFSFPIPKKYESLFSNIDGIPPMEFPDRTTPVTSRIFLYSGNNMRSPEVPAIQMLSKENFYFEEIIVKISQGITFNFRRFTLDFNSSAQDVLSTLGSPSKIFYKEEDKMKIHTSSYSGLGCADYFYNYFSLGIDILFDIHTHIIKKFILHTNFPSHYEFNQYVKCNFKILVPDKPELEISNEKKDQVTIDSDTKWNEVQLLLGAAGKPVVHSGGSNTNPFGPTLFYGYRDISFEVMRNNHIASVCLWSK